MTTKYVKIPFNVDIARKVTLGEIDGKILTNEGYDAKIICWNSGYYPFVLIALTTINGLTRPEFYTLSGEIRPPFCNKENLSIEVPEYVTFKNGEIVTFEDGSIGILKLYEYNPFSLYAILCKEGVFYDYNLSTTKNIRKAYKSEKKKLIKALKEVGDEESKGYLKRFFK